VREREREREIYAKGENIIISINHVNDRRGED
jgi:hypothetical protein